MAELLSKRHDQPDEWRVAFGGLPPCFCETPKSPPVSVIPAAYTGCRLDRRHVAFLVIIAFSALKRLGVRDDIPGQPESTDVRAVQ